MAAFVGLIHGFAIGFGLVSAILGAAIAVTLTLLVSRYRKNWARWTLVALFLIGVLGLVVGLFFGVTQQALGVTYPGLTLLVWLLSTIALALLFTPESSDWLRSAQAES